MSSRDLAFIWGGANDFLSIARATAPDPIEIEATVRSGVSNLTTAVSNLQAAGIGNFAFVSLFNLGLAPGIDGFKIQGARLADDFNARLKSRLDRLQNRPDLLWIDALINGMQGALRWQGGLRLSFLSGDLSRGYSVGTFAFKQVKGPPKHSCSRSSNL